MKKKAATINIDKLFDKCADAALLKVEEMARKILKKHPHLDYFMMAMGTYFFVDKKGNTINTQEEFRTANHSYSWRYTHKYFQPLTEFIMKWDDAFKLTGNPMKFTAEGNKITDW